MTCQELRVFYFKYNPNIKFKIKTKEEINPILYFCYITGEREFKKVSVVNILGFDYMCYNLENNLCKNMNYFFNEQGTGYQRRSISMIEMNKVESFREFVDNTNLHLVDKWEEYEF